MARSEDFRSDALEQMMRGDDLPDLASLLDRPLWHELANCLGVGPEVFFSAGGRSSRQAKALCAECVVRAECLAAATAGRERGTWAGTSERERRRQRRGDPTPASRSLADQLTA